MDPIQELIEIEKIKRLRARYWRTLDTKDWEGFGNVFTQDATFKIDAAVATLGADPMTHPIISTRAGIVAAVQSLLKDCLTVHTGRAPEIDILSETEAKAIWQQEDYNECPQRFNHGHGHYHDTYRKENGEWLISSVHLTRLRMVDTHRQVSLTPRFN